MLAAAALLVVAGAATAQRIIYPDVPEPELEAAIESIWAGSDCVSPADARQSVQQQLDQLGYADWTIDVQPGTDEARCAAGAVLTSLHEIRLMPGISLDIERAKDVITEGLLSECMNREEAAQFVSSVLTTAGSDPFVVRPIPGDRRADRSTRWTSTSHTSTPAASSTLACQPAMAKDAPFTTSGRHSRKALTVRPWGDQESSDGQ